MTDRPLLLGTRGSDLARTQSSQVAAAITAATGRPVELRIIRTRGDIHRDKPLSEVGGKGLFTKEIEVALLDGTVDLAVHSMKDMPTEQPEGLVFGAVPDREDPRDVLVGGRLDDLPAGAVVGTGSARRGAQIADLRPDLVVKGIRGNVETRIAKQRAGEYDVVVLAAAGIRRLGLEDAVTEWLPPERVIPAVGQGALAVQCREGDRVVLEVLSAIHDPVTGRCIEAERAFLAHLGGGCSVPLACWATLDGDRIELRAFGGVGGGVRRAHLTGAAADAVALGREAAERVRG